MFCPKCGTKNPETGKFCRSCGTDLGNVSSALSTGNRPQLLNHKGKPIHWEGAFSKFATGLAFLIISIVLAVSGNGRGWWFWMLIPAFSCIGAGVSQYMQLKRAESGQPMFVPPVQPDSLSGSVNQSLPPAQTNFERPDTKYNTGDLMPPSVTDNTTRHLEMDSEGKTMTLPKK